MTFREVTLEEILTSVGDGGEDPGMRVCIAAIAAYPRASYAIGGTPADELRESLEVKYRRAMTKGRTLVGDSELLMHLQERGGEPIAGVSAHGDGKHFFLYLVPATLAPVGAVIMYEPIESDSA